MDQANGVNARFRQLPAVDQLVERAGEGTKLARWSLLAAVRSVLESTRGAMLAGSASAIALAAAMLKAAEMTQGEYEREVSAPGVAGRGSEAHRPRTERLPGNQKSGVPMWIRYSKNLRSPSTWNQGDMQPLRGVHEQRV